MTTPRASKKQQELLQFIDGFIQGNGYGPSYREVMRALGYKSVSTVASHVDQLIAKGYLEKSDNSARSLAVVKRREADMTTNQADVERFLERKIAALRRADDTEAAKALEKTLEILRREQ